MNKEGFLMELKSCAEAGVRLVQCISARDEIVCQLCSEREKEIFTIEEFKQVLKKPLCEHQRCRCCLVALVTDRDILEEVWKRYPAATAVLKTGILSKAELGKTTASGDQIITNDTVWAAFNKKSTQLIKSGDWLEMGKLYREMAMFLNKEAKQHHHLLEESIKCEIQFYEKHNITKFQILTSCCEYCDIANKKQMNSRQALKTMTKIIRNCSRDVLSNGKGFCVCSLTPA